MNVLTGGGGAAAFKEANGLMAKEFQKSILVSSGHPVSYWQAVERKKLEEDNRVQRFNAGLGTEQDLGSE
jgi:hypothetical protein